MKTVVGRFAEFTPAHEAVGVLLGRGDAQTDISLVGHDVARERAEQVTPDEHDEGAEFVKASGMLGLLDGFGELELPGVGPLVAAGPLLGLLSGALAAAGERPDALCKALQALGVPAEDAERHAAALAGGATLLVVRTTDALADVIAATLAAHGAVTAVCDLADVA